MKKAPEAFRTISEVADLLETPAHVLRFWESKFYQIRPVKRAGGRRYYRPDDVALIAGIKHLLQDRGMTIRGVQKVLQEQGVRHVMRLAPPVVLEDEAEDGVVSFPGGEAAYAPNETVETAETAQGASDPVSPPDDAPGDDAPVPPSARPVAPAPVSATVSRLPVAPPRFRPDGADTPAQPDQPRADSVSATEAGPDSLAPDRAPVAGAGPASDAPDAPPPAMETSPAAPQDDAPDSAAPETPTPDAWAPEPSEDDPVAPEPAEPDTPAPDTPLPDVLPAAARQAPTEAKPDAQPPVAQTAVADRPAQMLRRIPRGGVGARSGQFGLLARRMDALLDRMSEASGAGRW